MMCMQIINGRILSLTVLFLPVKKLSALSASLTRVVSTAEEDEAELDQFPIEGVRKQVHKIRFSVSYLFQIYQE